jgi:SPP1 family predicted phage head-tail adaptor
MTTRIGSGERRHKIRVQTATEVIAAGELTRTFATVKVLWGRVKQLNGKEADVAKQIAPSATHEVVIPFYSSLDTEARLLIRTKVYGIVSIDNRDLEDVELVCLCEEAK